MRRFRSIKSVMAVGLVTVAFMFALGPVESVEESAYDFSVERTVSIQAFLDAAPPGWSRVRTRVPPPGGGPVLITSFPVPDDPCREMGASIRCEGLPPIMLPPGLPPGSVLIRIETARDLLIPRSLVTPPPEGKDLMVNGYRTMLIRAVGGPCVAVGADEKITIVIPTLGDWIGRTTVVACLRGPGLAELETALLALIERAAP